MQRYLSFGRLRPTHVNLAIFGWLSQVYMGGIFYILPRLTRARLFSEGLARTTWWLWNLMILGALVSLPAGWTQGREYAELIWPLDLLFIVCMVLLAVNIWGTVLRRREPKIYVSLWNFMAATVVMIPIYAQVRTQQIAPVTKKRSARFWDMRPVNLVFAAVFVAWSVYTPLAKKRGWFFVPM